MIKECNSDSDSLMKSVFQKRDSNCQEKAPAVDRILVSVGANPRSIRLIRTAMQMSRLMIEKLHEVLDQEHLATSTKYLVEISHSVAEQFSALGHKVNMMAIKGDLLLSGTNFNPQQQDAK